MTHIQYFSYKGVGEKLLNSRFYNQAVRVGETIHISGQDGWDRDTFAISRDLQTQIGQAFSNVDFALKDAGGQGWSQVFRVNTYHVPLNEEAMEAMQRNFERWMPDHKALWTYI